jgi:ankyrin repeat protein
MKPKKSGANSNANEKIILDELTQMENYLAEPRIAEMVGESMIERINNDILRIRTDGSASFPPAQLSALLGFLDRIAAIPPEEPKTPLFEAVEAGNIKLLKKLIDSGVDVNLPRADGTTALMVAAENGQDKIAIELIKGGANVNTRRKDTFSALLIACFLGHEKVVKVLAENGADVNGNYTIPSKAGLVENNTCLTIAAHQHKLSVCKLLLTLGADINAVTDVGYTPLMSSLVNATETDMALFLLKAGAHPDPDAVCRVPFGEATTPLVMAANNGLTEVVDDLIRRKVGINKVDWSGNTALKRAVSEGHVSTVRSLLSAGAKLDIPDNEGWTALMNAASNRNFDLVKLLVKSGADVNAKALDGSCALGLAVATRTRASGIAGLQSLLAQLSNKAPELDEDYDELSELSLTLIDYLLTAGASPMVKLERKSLVAAAGDDKALLVC